IHDRTILGRRSGIGLELLHADVFIRRIVRPLVVWAPAAIVARLAAIVIAVVIALAATVAAVVVTATIIAVLATIGRTLAFRGRILLARFFNCFFGHRLVLL